MVGEVEVILTRGDDIVCHFRESGEAAAVLLAQVGASLQLAAVDFQLALAEQAQLRTAS